MRDTVRDHAPAIADKPTLRAACLALVVAAAAIAAVAFAADTPPFAENGPAETAQLALWIGAALFAFVLMIPQPRVSDRAAMIFISLAAAAAAAREIDAHVLLNPETIGEFGVRYRIDWWLDGGVSPIRKLIWAIIALSAAAAVAGAALAARFHPILALKRRSRAVICFAAAGLCLVLGFTFDDLLRGVIQLTTAQAIEESIEVLAPLLYLAGANHLAASALTGGRARLHAEATGTLRSCHPKPTSSPSPHSTSTASPSASLASITTTRPASATASAPSSTT